MTEATNKHYVEGTWEILGLRLLQLEKRGLMSLVWVLRLGDDSILPFVCN